MICGGRGGIIVFDSVCNNFLKMKKKKKKKKKALKYFILVSFHRSFIFFFLLFCVELSFLLLFLLGLTAPMRGSRKEVKRERRERGGGIGGR